jgi:hypothetical protein
VRPTTALFFLSGCLPGGCFFSRGDPSDDSHRDSPGNDDSTGVVDSRAPFVDTAIESVPGDTATPVTPMCHVRMSCDGEIRDRPKTQCSISVTDGWGRSDWSGPAGVELRGRSSLDFPKHQYGIELWDEHQQPASANLLGMGGESDWILNGVYVDRALFRNKLSYDLFQSFGDEPWGQDSSTAMERYAAESAFCDVSLDGRWLGIFLLQERIKRDDDRLELEADDAGGSFIVKTDDGTDGILDASADFYGAWTLVWPSPSKVTDAQLAGIRSYLSSWQTAVLGPDPSDPTTGVPSFLDLDSAADFILLQEFARNNDAYTLSVHLWRDVGGKLHFTPWDIDLSFGYPKMDCGAEGWLRRTNAIEVLATMPEFDERLARRWFQLRKGPMEEQAVLDRIAGYRSTFGHTIDRNFKLWPIDQIQFCWGGVCWLCPISSYQEEYDRFRSWVSERLTWMDANIDAF